MPISLHTGWTLIFVATAVVACSLVPPRPPWRRLRRRPGFLVAATLVTFASFASVYTLLPLLLRRGPWGDAFLGGFLYGVPTMAGIAVTATLVTLLLLGRVRPAPGWPDRLGVAVGWASAGFLAFSYTRELLLYVLMSR